MNSFYKKIVLVCLVSLTANQAAQAFQFSDVWSWMKNHPKTSVLIGYLGLVGTLQLYIHITKARQKQHNLKKFEEALEVDVYVNPGSDLVKQNPTKFKRWDHVQNGLRQEDFAQLNSIYYPDQETIKKYFSTSDASAMLYVVRVHKDIVGAAVCEKFERVTRKSAKMIKDLRIDRMQSVYVGKVQSKLIGTILSENQDDMAFGTGTGDPFKFDVLLQDHIQRVDGTVKFAGDENYHVYDRSAARAKLVQRERTERELA